MREVEKSSPVEALACLSLLSRSPAPVRSARAAQLQQPCHACRARARVGGYPAPPPRVGPPVSVVPHQISNFSRPHFLPTSRRFLSCQFLSPRFSLARRRTALVAESAVRAEWYSSSNSVMVVVSLLSLPHLIPPLSPHGHGCPPLRSIRGRAWPLTRSPFAR